MTLVACGGSEAGDRLTIEPLDRSPRSGEATAIVEPTATPVPSATIAPPPSATPVVVAPTPTAAQALVPPTVAPPPPPPPPPAARVHPDIAGVKVWTNGDSTSYFMSHWVIEGTRALGGAPVQAAAEYQISSGLLTPQFFDWPAFVAAEMARTDPEVVVLMVGANDAVGAPDLAAYAGRVGAMMDQLQGRTLIWVGQPAMGRADLAANIPAVNAVFQSEAAKRPWVSYINAFALTSDASGNYTQFLADEAGVVIQARADDGVHFTSAGGKIIANAVIYAIASR
jgi:hypothetical protein